MKLLQVSPVRPAPRMAVLLLLATGLALAACAPITPPAEAAAMPAGTASPGAATAELAPEVAAGIQRVEEFADNANSGGRFSGTVLIAKDGAILWSKSYGMADREQAIPNTPQTIHRIYEATVQFTAAAMLLLEQEGKLSVDDPICDYLDDCPEAWQPVTIHHLLSHTSGIPDYFDVAAGKAYEFSRAGTTPDALVELFRTAPLEFEPGSYRDWSHSGFVLAGQIVERVSGQPYGDFVEQHLFAPLGMHHTGYGDPPEGITPGYIAASGTATAAFDVSSLFSSGGLYSTAEDLYRWNEALYNDQLLNETQLQKMLTGHAEFDMNEGSGYGIVLGEIDGHRWAGTGGGRAGHGATMTRYLDENTTLVLIGNQFSDAFTLTQVLESVLFGGQ